MKKFMLYMMLVTIVFSIGGCYSCQSWNNLWGKGPVEPYAEHKFFFDKDCKPMVAAAPKAEPKPAEAPKPAPKPQPAPAAAGSCGPYTVSRTHPCGDCGVVKIEKVMPKEVQLNAQFNYDIMVINMTDMDIADVVVTEHIDKNFEFKSASPSPKVMDGKLVWAMDSMAPKATQKITVTGMAKAAECMKYCATVTYVMPACTYVQVVQPQLRLVKTAPAEVLICDPIPVKMVVTNTGTGSAQNIKIEDMLPEGLMTADGKRSVVLDAGTLGAGQSKEFTMSLKASKTGRFVNSAVATSAGGLKSEASTTTVVRQPVLTIAKSAPERLYLGRAITYDITVGNKGDAAAANLIVEDVLPAGTKFVSATQGGQFSAGKVVWNLGNLASGDSRKLSVTVTSEQAGMFANSASAVATCADKVTASARTTIAGIPAILLEVIDVEDPIPVGSNETYVITVTNQGSATDTNVTIVCTLEEEMQYISSAGPTTGQLRTNQVVFAPLPRLAPQEKATWRVVVKALKPGDVRFKVSMNSDQLERPVEETEATYFY
ncbi:MAG: hypothetical protein WCZ89_02580 [Phycisphaerae bacterium]